MSDWSDLFLGIIALATLVLAVIQVGAIIFAARLGRQLRDLMTSVQQDVRPLAAKAAGIAEDASRTAALAREQAEKIDRLVNDLSARVDQTAAVVQEAIVTPAREGLAVVAAIKAGLGVLRSVRDYRAPTRRAEDEDALFIG